jgi:hypothetical protein
MNECLSCGDKFLPPAQLSKEDSLLTGDARELVDKLHQLRHTRCQTCAGEILGITIPRIGTTMHGTGGGERVIRSAKGMS